MKPGFNPLAVSLPEGAVRTAATLSMAIVANSPGASDHSL